MGNIQRLRGPVGRGRRMKVGAAVALTAGILAAPLLAASAASADGPGNMPPLDRTERVVETRGVGEWRLFILSDGSAAYCLDYDKKAPPRDHELDEVGWGAYEGSSKPWNEDPSVRGKVLWVLSHSYPALSATEVADLTGLPTLSEDELIAATQAAIWHFTNNRASTVDSENARRLSAWLVGNATPIEPNEADGGSVDLVPGEGFRNQSGAPVGPFTVVTEDIATARLTASAGVTVVDAGGAPVEAAHNGEKVWLSASVAHRATLTATGTYVHNTGTIWIDPLDPRHVQELTKGSASPIVRQDIVTVDLFSAAPTLVTAAIDKADDDQVLPSAGGTVTDKVVYTGLVAGNEYTLKGELMDRATGASTGIAASKTFIATGATGSVLLDFTVPAGFAGKSLVAFETLLNGSGEVASHRDLASIDQTVTVEPSSPYDPEEPGTPGDPGTPGEPDARRPGYPR